MARRDRSRYPTNEAHEYTDRVPSVSSGAYGMNQSPPAWQPGWIPDGWIDLLRPIMTVMTGSGATQLFTVVTMPIVARLYPPDAFGVLASFLAASTIAASLAAGKYEMAILLPATEPDGARVCILALCLSIVVGVPVGAMAGVVSSHFGFQWQSQSVTIWSLLVCLGTVLSACGNVIQYWLVRQGRYGAAMLLNAMNVVLNVLAALVGFLFGGRDLVVPLLLSSTAVTIVGLWVAGKGLWPIAKSTSHADLRRTATRYSAFPRFTLPSVLVETIGSQLPVFLIGSALGTSTLGVYSMAQRVLRAPLGVVSSAAGVVFRREAAISYSQTGTCRQILTRTTWLLLPFSIAISAVVLFGGGRLFVLLLGPKWTDVGIIAQYLVPAVAFGMVASPVSNVLFIAERQRLNFILQSSSILFSVGALTVGLFVMNSLAIALLGYSLCYTAKYVVEWMLSYKLSVAPRCAGQEREATC